MPLPFLPLSRLRHGLNWLETIRTYENYENKYMLLWLTTRGDYFLVSLVLLNIMDTVYCGGGGKGRGGMYSCFASYIGVKNIFNFFIFLSFLFLKLVIYNIPYKSNLCSIISVMLNSETDMHILLSISYTDHLVQQFRLVSGNLLSNLSSCWLHWVDRKCFTRTRVLTSQSEWSVYSSF